MYETQKSIYWQSAMPIFQLTEPKFIVILWDFKPATAWSQSQLRHGIAPMPMLHEMSIQKHKVSSHPFPPPSLFTKKPVLKISRQIKK
jgi:hypothetical protein